MAEFEPPSFSLGLDFDLHSEPQPTTTVRKDPLPSCKQARQSSSANPSFRLIDDDDDDDDDFETPATGRVPHVSDPPRTLKRLRRGPPSESSPAAQKREGVELRCSVDDEIEEFSSQEDRCRVNEYSSSHYQSGCSSSKFPLRGHGVLTKQSASEREVAKRKEAPSTSASASLETSTNKLLFPKLTDSPLRRFQLIDSDSDDPSVCEDANRETNKVDSSMKEKQHNPGQYSTTSEQKRTKLSVSASQTEDLWKDFYAEKSFNIPTPALDEFCDEYFRSVKDKNEVTNLRPDKGKSDHKGSFQNLEVITNDEHRCPAHRYFFHDDPRIQKLVSSRLSYFFPLGAVNNSGNNQSMSSVIDYIGQFSQGEGSKQQAAGKTNAETSSRKGKKNLKKSNAEEASHGSESWVNPKSSVGIAKDAGKRRVHAVGQSGGHWYTGPDGKRVYISKNGQELTGRIAYRHYRKESGAGFQTSKKKTAKKTASKKATAATKKKPAATRKPAATKKKPAAKKK